MKNTILEDFMKIYNSLECDGIKFCCNKCSNKKLCDLVERVINSISDFYVEV